MKSRRFLIPIAVAFVASCGRSPPRKSVFLITMDAVGAGHVSVYGYERPTTPNLDRLAERGARFERAVAPVPAAAQCLAGVMTARTPVQHQLRHAGHELLAEHETLAERMHAAGFATAAFVALPGVEDARGFDQGFDTFHHASGREGRAAALVDAAADWIDAHAGDPYFVWIHFGDPALPFAPPAEFRDRFDSEYEGEYDESFHYWPFDEDGRPRNPANLNLYRELEARLRFGERRLSERDHARVVGLYDAEIATVDHAIGRLLERRSAAGRTETLTVATATYGIGLGEHGVFYDRGDGLRDTDVRVPLVIAGSGIEPTVASGQVGLTDLGPTILELAGTPPFERVQGRSFAAAVLGRRIQSRGCFLVAPEPSVWHRNPRFEPRWAELADARPRAADVRASVVDAQSMRHRTRAFSTQDLKIVLDPLAPADRRVVAFAVRDDPGETVDVSRDESRLELVQRGTRMLEWIVEMELMREVGRSVVIEGDLRDVQLLAESGYVVVR